jgi:cobalt-zinc-cadmium efflux system membrane fusion protein
MKTKSIIIIIYAGILLASCSHKQAENQNSDTGDSLITITQEQFIAGKLILGNPVKMSFENVVRCNGNIVTEPSGNARISTPVQGFIRNIKCSGGQKVFRGQELFELSGNEFIELQKDLAETASQLKRLNSEYERIKSLYEEKVGTEKDLILAESEYRASNAKYSALRIKIRSLGLDESRIESGDFYESFSLRSPINGSVSKVDVAIGQYADLQTILAEVFDTDRLRLKLEVFEKDFNKLREGQTVKFNLLGDTGKYYSASLRAIGKNIDEGTKTITCYAGMNDSGNESFVNNAFISAAIITKNDTVTAVPEEAVLRSEGNSYILEFIGTENSNYLLKRIRTLTGRMNNGYAEILNIPPETRLIIKGAYNIRVE